MLDPLPPIACQKAREAVSLQLDGELSELGSLRLATHLRRCEACSAHALELTATLDLLRSAPLEQLAFVLQPRRRASSARIMTVAATAVAVATGLFLSAGALRVGQRHAFLQTKAAGPPALGAEVAARSQALPAALILRHLGRMDGTQAGVSRPVGPTPV